MDFVTIKDMVEGQLFRKIYLLFIGIFAVGCNVQGMNNARATLDIDVADKYIADECKGNEVDLALQTQFKPCFLAEDIDGQNRGVYNRLLISAVSLRNPIGARSALENNANPNAIMYNGESVLMHAARYGDAEIVKLLLWCKAEVNPVTKSNKTPLIEAVLHGCCGRYASIQDYRKAIWALVVADGDVCAKTKIGHTVFELATPIIKETIGHAQEVKERLEYLEYDD